MRDNSQHNICKSVIQFFVCDMDVEILCLELSLLQRTVNCTCSSYLNSDDLEKSEGMSTCIFFVDEDM